MKIRSKISFLRKWFWIYVSFKIVLVLDKFSNSRFSEMKRTKNFYFTFLYLLLHVESLSNYSFLSCLELLIFKCTSNFFSKTKPLSRKISLHNFFLFFRKKNHVMSAFTYHFIRLCSLLCEEGLNCDCHTLRTKCTSFVTILEA